MSKLLLLLLLLFYIYTFYVHVSILHLPIRNIATKIFQLQQYSSHFLVTLFLQMSLQREIFVEQVEKVLKTLKISAKAGKYFPVNAHEVPTRGMLILLALLL